ncbi:MAG: hypothetical protein ACLTZT_17055 [Butyricimonas faecalis]
MKEARFVSQNKEKWEKMEHVSHLDTDSIASNYVILSDDLSYAKTFYPGSDVVKYLNQLISFTRSIFTGRSDRRKRVFFLFGCGNSCCSIGEADLVVCSPFLLFAALIGVFSTAKDDTFVRLILGDAYVDETLENIEKGTRWGFIHLRMR